MDAVPTTHPTEQTLRSYGLGKLDEAQAESLNQHLETCDECRQIVAAVSADSLLGRAREAHGAIHSTFGQSLLNAAQSKKSEKPAPPADTLPPGLAEHPDYKILRELGRGGMGVVYLAHNELMGRDEVLKVMSRQIMERPGVLDRFMREIRAVAKLRHSNIVTAYTAFHLQENLVFAMEFVDGLDLAKLVKAKGQLPVAHACHFVHQAALGLQNAHENGLVHRDIKPHNLMLSRSGDRALVKILDFGLAKATREEKVDSALTSAGQALGTPDFIAPEQILDAQTADIRADIYSLGGTLFYLLAGRPPFEANSLYDLYQAHISRNLDPLNIIRPAVPSELAALVGKMMAKETKGRFQTPDEVARALVPFFKRGSATALPRPLNSEAAPPPPVVPTPVVAPTITAPVVPAEPQWQSLIADMEPVKPMPVAASKAAPSPPRTRWRLPMMVGLSVFGLFVLLAGVTLKLKLQGATVTIENLPDGATVAVDDKAVTPARDGEKTTLKLTHGEHQITVDLSGERRHEGTVTVDWGATDPVVINIKPIRSMASQPQPEPSKAAPVARAAEGTTAGEERDDNALEMKFCWCPAGSFRMGSPPDEPERGSDEGPVNVTLSRGFWMGKFEVTQSQWQKAMGTTLRQLQAKKRVWGDIKGDGPDRPVYFVTHKEASEFCRAFTESERTAGRLPVGWEYGLPTEAQWEYACRATTTTATAFGDRLTGVQANVDGEHPYNGAAKGPSREMAMPVGGYPANPWGLHDMHGNVWEWCSDVYDETLPGGVDPHRSSNHWGRLIRGGAWSGPTGYARSARRDQRPPDVAGSGLGFRVARVSVGVPQDRIASSPGGLVAFYGFNDGKAEDLSGHGHHGEFSANPPVKSPGTEGDGLAFNSSQHNFITLPLNINPDVMPQITMGGWVRINQPNRRQTLISHDNGWFDRTLAIDSRGRDDGKKRWSAFNGQKVVAVADVEAERWTFVALRHDQKTANLTVDVNDTRVTHPGLFSAGWKKTFIGRNPFFGNGADLDGRVDNVFFYNRVLDDQEIDAIRAQGSAAILPEKPAQAVTTAAPSALAPPSAETGFAPLFNGKNLEGWRTDPAQPGNWRIESGVLVGSASAPSNGRVLSHLYSTRTTLSDVDLRVEARVNAGGEAGVQIRSATSPTWPEPTPRYFLGYKAQIFVPPGTHAPTGSLFIDEEGAVSKPPRNLIRAGEWFTLELSARGNHVVVKVDGQTTADYMDQKRPPRGGTIALQVLDAQSKVEFRRVEVRQVPPVNEIMSSGTSPPGAGITAKEPLRKAQPPAAPDKETKTVPKKADRPADKPRAPMTEGARVGQERADNGLKMKFCWCPAGRFSMGSPPYEPGRSNNEGSALVTLSRGFWIGKFEVTQAQWTQLMGTTIEQQNAKAGKPDLRGVGPAFPMYFVSHTEAEEFARKLTLQERGADRLPSTWEYRLPTEAEWEYACRAGTTTATAFGDQLGSTDANCMGHEHPYNGALKGPYLAQTCPVGSYRPNACGVYDMHGNVWEWCRDGYAENPAGGVDPQGSANSSERMLRGGGWITWPVQCRSAGRRVGRKPSDRLHDLGFRLVLAP